MRTDGQTAKQNKVKKSVGTFWEHASASKSRLVTRILTACRLETWHMRMGIAVTSTTMTFFVSSDVLCEDRSRKHGFCKFLGVFANLWICLSVLPSFCPHGTTLLALDGYSLNLLFKDFSKVSRRLKFHQNLKRITDVFHEKAKQSHYRPGQGPEVSRRFRFPDFKTICTWRW